MRIAPEALPLSDLANVFSAMSQHYRTSALYVARAEDPEVARAEVVGILDRMIDGLAA